MQILHSNLFEFKKLGGKIMIDNNVFRDVSYGLYIISTKYNEKNVGCVINTLSQVTSENPVISCSINKNNYTSEAIKATKKFAISIISEKIKEDVIYRFGYNSSKDVDKFVNCIYEEVDETPVVTEGMCSYLICDLIQTVDCGTHDIFIGKVIGTKKLSKEKEMTYRYYHEVIKAVAPKNAPTYIEVKENAINNDTSNTSKNYDLDGNIDKEKNENNSGDNSESINQAFEKYRCIVCGYIYDEAVEKVKFSDLPDDWKCPRCGVGKENFVKIEA